MKSTHAAELKSVDSDSENPRQDSDRLKIENQARFSDERFENEFSH